MKRSLLAFLAFALAAFFTSGCSHYSSGRHRLTNNVAIALTVNGTEQPTPEQWVAIFKAVEPQLASLGWVLVTDLSKADRLIRIDFTPNPLDPQNSGHATVLSMTLNPRGPSAIASVRSSSPVFSYASYPSNNAFANYDYYDRWSDGSYSYTPPRSSTPPSHNRPNHPGNNRDDCPPGTTERPPRYADNGNRSTPPARDNSNWRDHTPTPSYSSPSYSSSSSSSDYSSSSSSSSSSSFSSSSSSSSSGGGSFSGSSGTSDSHSNRQQN